MKRCPYCAERIKDEAVVCRYCRRELPKGEVDPSAAPNGAIPPPQDKPVRWNSELAVICFIVGILNLVTQALPLAFMLFVFSAETDSEFLGILALLDMALLFSFIAPMIALLVFGLGLVLGVLALIQIKKHNRKGRWMAITGFALSALGCLVGFSPYLLMLFHISLNN